MSPRSPATPSADCSILGLGAMGAAVAGRLLEAGLRVAVWNRSAGKADPLVAQGAVPISTAEDALLAAPVTLVVLSDIEVANSVLGEIRIDLSGRAVVNFSSGRPSDSNLLHQQMHNLGAGYLRGSITSYPRNVGHPQSCFFYSGDADVYETHNRLLAQLSGETLFLSEADASALGAAVTIQAFVAMGGFYEAIGAGTQIGAGARGLASNLRKASRFLFLDAIDDATRRLEQQDFGGQQATIDTHIAHVAGLTGTLKARGIATPLLDAFLATMEGAHTLGYGHEDIAAICKALATARDAFSS